MKNAGTNRKALIIGIIAAVVVLGALLGIVLTQCNAEQPAATTTATETTEGVPTYTLYWNVDRAEYDGKSEAGMSSRMPESDGYFHVRFILDGKEVTLKVADRKLINAIDIKDLMGLEFDENGIVSGVISLDDMPLEKTAWQFYVQSFGGKTLKANSSSGLNGMEVLLEGDNNTLFMDMTGKEGPLGTIVKPIPGDRILAVSNLAGDLTHVFVYERPTYMLTHEAECEHCGKVVTWSEWVNEKAIPLTTGHYQLQVDVTTSKQSNTAEDSKICLDLNGHRIDGGYGARVYAMFNSGSELAIMDTSEAKTGTIAAHGSGGDAGLCVWVRYGAFYLYDGIMDGSDATSVKNGTTVTLQANTFMYMYGGEIIGGTSKYVYNEANKTYSQGMGGAMCLNGKCKFTMYDGVIRDGYAEGKVTARNADGSPKTYQRGSAGNIFMSSGSVLEMYGGVIKNGKATTVGGNIHMDGTSELIIDGGKIQGGTSAGKGKNGGSIYVSTKSTVYLKSGSITGGTTYNAGGNVYLNGTFIMSGGYIGGGVVRNFSTRKVTEDAASRNVFIVNGTFKMYGGTIDGGVQATDSSATDNKRCYVGLSTYANIYDEESTKNLSLAYGAGGPVHVRVDNLRDSAKIGVNATTGIFTDPTIEGNVDNFVSDIEGAEVLYYDGCLALGRMQCICGSEEHFGACDGTEQLWAPHLTTNALPNRDGYFYLLTDVTSGTNYLRGTTDVHTRLDLNGHAVLGPSGKGRTYSLFENQDTYDADGNLNPDIVGAAMKLTITDSVGTGKITMREYADLDQGGLIWGRYGDSEINIYGGTFDGTAATSVRHNGAVISSAGNVNIYGGHFIGGNSVTGGIIAVSKSGSTLTMTGGTIEGGIANGSSGGGNIYIAGGVTFNLSGGTIKGGQGKNGGNIYLAKNAIMNMSGGTIADGRVDNSAIEMDGGIGGNIYQSDSGTFTMTGGVIENGYVRGGTKGGGHGGNIGYYGNVVLLGGTIRNGYSSSAGGNIATISSNATIFMDGVRVENGKANGNGGNLGVHVRNAKSVVIKGDTVITGGQASNGGNLAFRAGTTSVVAMEVNISDVTISGGTATNYGGNIYMYNDTKDDKAFETNITLRGVTLEGGSCGAQGGNIFFEGRGTLVIEDSVLNGGSAKQGGNLFTYTKIATTIIGSTISNGLAFKDGDAGSGGNIYAGNKGQLMILGSTISGGIARGNMTGKYPTGGNIYILDNYVTLDEGTVVSGGQTQQQVSAWTAGGNVYAVRGTVDINDATIVGGYVDSTGSRQGYNLYICKNAVVNLNGGKIENTIKANQSIYFEGGVFNLNAGEVITTGGVYSRNFASKADVGGTININGGKVSGGFYETGGNFHLPSSFTLNISGGLIEGGKAELNGGNILAAKGSVVNMTGGTISGGENTKASNNGGSIYIYAGAEFNMSGGTIKDGRAMNIGGNIYNAGTMNISGDALITGGTMAGTGNASGNIAVVNGTLNISGGVIDGDVGVTNSGKAGATVNLSGKVVINRGNIGGIYLSYYNYDYPATVTIDGTLEEGSLIVVKSREDTVITSNAVAEENLKYFQAEVEGKQIVWLTDDRDIDGDGTSDLHKLAFGLMYCICGVDSDDPADHLGECGGKLLTWLPWDKTDSLPTTTGNWYLTGNVTLTTEKTIDTSADINIDLNGKTVTTSKNMRVFRIRNAEQATTVNLAVTDTSAAKTGAVIHTVASGTCDGHIVWLTQDGHTFSLYGGKLDASAVVSSTHATAIKANRGVVNIYGGSVLGGTTSDTSQNGAAIRISGPATMNMTGGSVTGGFNANQGGTLVVYGTANLLGGTLGGGTAASGSAISVIRSAESEPGKLVLNGTTIDGNIRLNAYAAPCDVTFVGKIVLEKGDKAYGLYTTGKATNIDVSGMTDGSSVDVCAHQDAVTFAKGANETIKNYFRCADGVGEIFLDGDKLTIGRESCVCGNIGGKHIEGACDGTVLRWKPWAYSNDLPTATGNYYLITDVTTTANKSWAKNANVVLDLNGHTVTRSGRLFTGKDITDSSYTITDTSAEQTGVIKAGGSSFDQGFIWVTGTNNKLTLVRGTIDGSGRTLTANSGLTIAVTSGGTFHMYGGKVIGGTYKLAEGKTPYGGCAIGNSGTTVIYGGEIVGGTSDQYGAAVLTTGGTFTMKDGSIVGGEAANGGSVAVLGGTFNLEGGTISAGQATALGGNVYVEKGTFTMTGGTLTGGKGGTHGGNIAQVGGTVDLLGGTIENGGVTSNASNSGGGNIAANAAAGKLTLNGVTVKDGSVAARGGNIYLYGAGIDMTIKGNTVISGGVANYGASICLNAWERSADDRAVVTMDGGKISGGAARANAGSVYIYENYEFILNNGVIENGTAKGDGGSVYLAGMGATSGEFIMNGGELVGGEAGKENTAARGGGNVYVAAGATFTLKNGTVSNGFGSSSGGNFLVKGTLVMEKGTISGGEVGNDSFKEKNGGNVAVESGATFEMKGGTVSGGKCNNSGGNIYVLGTLNMAGGTIKDGTAKNASSANIAVQGGTMKMSGGEIKGDVTIANTAASHDSKIILSGEPVIGIGTYGLKVIKVASGTAVPQITVDGSLGAKTDIVISSEVGDGVIGDTTAGAYAKYFSAQNAAKDVVKLDDGTLYLGKYGCVCGGVSGTECAKAGHPKVKWTVWNDATKTPGSTSSGKAGNYYLATDISVTGDQHYPYAGEINIDLNGFNITGSGDRLFRLRNDSNSAVDYAVVIGIKNSRNGNGKGVISATKQGAQEGYLVWMTQASQVFNLYSGVLDGSAATTVASKNGGCVAMYNGTFNMYGGEIKNGHATSGGGNVSVSGATSVFNLYGGTISGGSADNGGNIYTTNSGTANLAGGVVTGGNAKNGGNIYANANVNLKGATVEKGVASTAAGNIHITNNGNFVMTKGLVTGGNAAGDTVKDHENIYCKYGVVDLRGGQIDGFVMIHNYNTSASTIKVSGNIQITGAAKNLILVWGKDSGTTHPTNYPVIQLGKLEEGAKIGITSGTTLFATGSSITVDTKAYFTSDATTKQIVFTENGLELKASTEIWGCVCGGKAVGVGDHECVDVKWTETNKIPTESGNYILTTNVESDKQYDLSGQNINIDLNGYELSVKKGVSSGRVYRLVGGTVMNITDSSEAGTGKIIGRGGNDSNGQGGVFVMSAQAKLNLFAGTITSTNDNNSKSGGGVIYTTQAGTTFTMYGGRVTGGKTTAAGGNLWINSDSTFIMYGGKIDGGTSSSGKHSNIHLKFAHAEIYGGEITGGFFVQNYNASSSTIKIAGNPVIYGADATYNLDLAWSKESGTSHAVNYPVIELGELTEGANIHITEAANGRVFAEAADGHTITENDAKYITLDSTTLKITLTGGTLKAVTK